MSHVAAKESGRVWRRVKRAMLHLAIMVAASVGFLVGHDLGVSGNESLAQDKPAPEVHDVVTARLYDLDYRGRNAAVLQMSDTGRGVVLGLIAPRSSIATSLGVTPRGSSQLTVIDARSEGRFIVGTDGPTGPPVFSLNNARGYVAANYGEKVHGERPYIRFESGHPAAEVAFWRGDLALRSSKWRNRNQGNHIEVIPSIDPDGKATLKSRPVQ